MSDHPRDLVGRVFDLVFAAPADDRESVLARECGDDAGLRKRILVMIDVAESGMFSETPADDAPTIHATPHDGMDHISPSERGREQAGDWIGRYRLLQPIGEGGFGSVWMAEQREPVKRRVALKIIKLGMDTKQVIARFEAERQALAMMDHPNIAKVLDAGSTETGRPFFAMELVKGVPILEYCDTEKLDTGARLRLFIEICRAIQHAHQKGIIHRDIKPSNVLVAMHDGDPVPKVIDFGIAKATNAELTEKTLFTQHGQMIGTPAYMSPEQAEMSELDIDTRSDIYALGVLLYELLTGTTPFDASELLGKGFAEMMRFIREEEPPKPSTRLSTLGDTAMRTAQQRSADPKRLGSLLKGDLDWIVMKCLEKDRTRRYETANGLAADIERHMMDEPVTAGPPTAAYRMTKFVRRHRTGVGAACFVLAVVVGGTIATSIALRSSLAANKRLAASRASEQAQREAAQRSAEKFETINDLLLNMLASADPYRSSGEEVTVREVFEGAAAELDAGFDGGPLVEADVREVLGRVYRRMDRYDDAELQIRRAIALREAELGPHNRSVLAVRGQLGRILEQAGRNAEAESTLKAVHRLASEHLGDHDIDTAQHLRHLAVVFYNQARYAEALEAFERVHALRIDLLGGVHRKTLISLNDIAICHADMGNLDDAEPLARQYFDLTREHLGPDDPETATAMDNLALLYRDMERYNDAEDLMLEALDRNTAIFGEESRKVFTSHRSLGRLYSLMGKKDKARHHLETALDGFRAVIGAQHYLTCSTMYSLGKEELDRNQARRARELFVEARDGLRLLYGRQDDLVLTVTIYLASASIALGECEQAKQELEEVARAEVIPTKVRDQLDRVRSDLAAACPP